MTPVPSLQDLPEGRELLKAVQVLEQQEEATASILAESQRVEEELRALEEAEARAKSTHQQAVRAVAQEVRKRSRISNSVVPAFWTVRSLEPTPILVVGDGPR